MSDMNKQELRRLAHEASETEMGWLDRDWLASIMADDWADYVAAIDPSVVIALLDQCEALHAVLGDPDEINAEPAADYEALRKQFTSLLMLANSKCRQAQHWRAQSSHTMHQTILATAANVNAERATNAILTDALEHAEAERDRLRAENERQTELRRLEWNRAEALQAEVEGLRKDSRRWKCVRNAILMQSPFAVWREGAQVVLGKDADELLDNFLANAKEASHD